MLKLKNKIRKIKLRKLIPLSLIMALLISMTVIPSTAGVGGSVDSNNAQIDELNKKASQIAEANRKRQERISALQNDEAQQAAFISEVETQVAEIQAEVDAYKALMNAKQAEIDKIHEELEIKKIEIQAIEVRIQEREEEIAILDAENAENIEQFGQIVAQMYMTSGSDAISLLTGSTSFYDVLVRTEMIKNIGEKNAEIVEKLLAAIKRQQDAILELENDIEQLEEERFLLTERQRVYESEFNQLETERAAVSAIANERYDVLYTLTAERDALQSQVSSIRDDVNAAAGEINNIRSQIAELEAENRRIASFIAGNQNANSDRPNYSANGFIWPVDKRFSNITCYFGFDPWRNGMHSGIDIAQSGINGASVFAIGSGTVIKVAGGGGWNGGYGNYIIIDHGGGYSSLYAHLSSISVSNGAKVTQGDRIGAVGSTGWSTGPHLHFEIRRNGTAVNPLGYVSP